MGRRGFRRERRFFGGDRGPSEEVVQLRTKVARLERVLVEVLEASDAVLVDLHETENELALARRRVAPFTEEWRATESESHDFFAQIHMDARARQWLLAPRKRSLLSRVRFGRTQKVRPPVLPRLRPAMALGN